MLSTPATPEDMYPVEFRGRPFSELGSFRWGEGPLVGLGYIRLFCSPAASEACALMEARHELENLMVKLQLKKITIVVVARVLVGAPWLLSSGLSSTGLVGEESLVGKRLLACSSWLVRCWAPFGFNP